MEWQISIDLLSYIPDFDLKVFALRCTHVLSASALGTGRRYVIAVES